MKKIIYILVLLTLFAFVSCNKIQNNKINKENTEEIKELTIKWNECLIKRDLNTLKSMYAEQVSIYGKSISKEQALSEKQDFFANNKDFNQSIIGDIVITKITDNQYKSSFSKRSTFNGKTKDVTAYLVFDKNSDIWIITNESDLLSDKNNTNQSIAKEKNKLNSSCLDIVMKMLETSPRYLELTKGLDKAIIKNGGTSFGITVEGSPNPKIDDALDYSETYDFNIHETYPEHTTTIARFTFNPSKKQLYEYDVVNDKLNPIDFNKKLILEFDKVCK